MDDISFGTGGWRADNTAFTEDRVSQVGQAIATYLKETTEPSERTIVIGFDARACSPQAAETLTEVITANGIDVLLPDRDLPTPVIAYTIADRGLAGGLVVTASHNPPDYNGIKFITGNAMPPLPDVTNEIERHLAEPTPLRDDQHGSVSTIDPVPAHTSQAENVVARYFDIDLSGLTVVYDAMHGSARGITDDLLEQAGAEVVRQRCNHDPQFGGVAPEPTPESLRSLPELIDRHDADVGIANDGDGDRIAVCTGRRGVLTGHMVFAGLYDALLTDADVNGPAVRTVSTTFLIDRIAKAHDTSVIEVPVGFKYVAAAMRDHDALIGGEESGGFTIRGHIRQKDGVLLALLVCAATKRESFDGRLDRLTSSHGEIFADKISVPCPENRKPAVVAKLSDQIPGTIGGQAVTETVTVDGFKLLLEDGSWILIRPSGTEPKLRIYAETTDEQSLTGLLSAGRDLVDPLVEQSPSSEKE